MYFADLAPCSYGLLKPEGVSVGWLDKAYKFPCGVVPDGLVERLTEICKTPAVRHLGYHVCELCDFDVAPDFASRKAAGALSSTVIRVVGRDAGVYYSPAMICHYVAKHGYQPPEDFMRAVMETDIPMGPNKLPLALAVPFRGLQHFDADRSRRPNTPGLSSGV